MTEHEGFLFVCASFAERGLPEDDGNWDTVGPHGDLSIAEILNHFAESDDPMPAVAASHLGLAPGATYAEGVLKIWSDQSGRYMAPQKGTPQSCVEWRRQGF
jgi:hypothetical protein